MVRSRGWIPRRCGRSRIPAAAHLCIDVQASTCIGSSGPAWAPPRMPRVLPRIAEICAWHAGRSVFTRSIPALRAEARRRCCETGTDMTFQGDRSRQGSRRPRAEAVRPAAETSTSRCTPPGPALRRRLQAARLRRACKRRGRNRQAGAPPCSGRSTSAIGRSRRGAPCAAPPTRVVTRCRTSSAGGSANRGKSRRRRSFWTPGRIAGDRKAPPDGARFRIAPV